MSRSSATWCNTWYTGQRLYSAIWYNWEAKSCVYSPELNKIKSFHILSTSWHKYTLLERLVLIFLSFLFFINLKLPIMPLLYKPLASFCLLPDPISRYSNTIHVILGTNAICYTVWQWCWSQVLLNKIYLLVFFYVYIY